LADSNSTNDECIFTKELLFDIKVTLTQNTGLSLKSKILKEYCEYRATVVTPENYRIRIPRIDDFGDVINDSDSIESADLFDGKEIFL